VPGAQWLSLIVILLVVDVIGAPLAMVAFLFRSRAVIRSRDAAFKAKFGVLFGAFLLVGIGLQFPAPGHACGLVWPRPNCVPSCLETLAVPALFVLLAEAYRPDGLGSGWEVVTLGRRSVIILVDVIMYQFGVSEFHEILLRSQPCCRLRECAESRFRVRLCVRCVAGLEVRGVCTGDAAVRAHARLLPPVRQTVGKLSRGESCSRPQPAH
jgi:hypothetical protein